MRSKLTIPLVLFLALSWGLPVARAELVDRIVAIVDRDVVLLSEAEQARAVSRVRTGEEAPLVDVVDRLIEACLVEREVERFTSDPVPTELIDGTLDEVRSRFASESDFEAMLRGASLSPEELRSALARQLRIARYLERRFRALSFVSEEEVETYYRDELPDQLGGEAPPPLAEVSPLIRQLLEEREFNRRVEEWIEGLESRSKIKRYVW
jgi:hypothetical protein